MSKVWLTGRWNCFLTACCLTVGPRALEPCPRAQTMQSWLVTSGSRYWVSHPPRGALSSLSGKYDEVSQQLGQLDWLITRLLLTNISSHTIPSWCMDIIRMRWGGETWNELESLFVSFWLMESVDQHAKLWTKTIWLDSWEYLRCVVLSVPLMLGGGGGWPRLPRHWHWSSPLTMAPLLIGLMTLCGQSQVITTPALDIKESASESVPGLMMTMETCQQRWQLHMTITTLIRSSNVAKSSSYIYNNVNAFDWCWRVSVECVNIMVSMCSMTMVCDTQWRPCLTPPAQVCSISCHHENYFREENSCAATPSLTTKIFCLSGLEKYFSFDWSLT